MTARIVEFFGHEQLDPAAKAYVSNKECPFVSSKCIKPKHGACTIETTKSGPVIFCPNRLYADSFKVLLDVATQAFGAGVKIIDGATRAALKSANAFTGSEVAVFGKYWGKELSIPQPVNPATGIKLDKFYIDYVLARLDSNGEIDEFTALEVQSIDTTESYIKQSKSLFAGEQFEDSKGRKPGWTKGGLNWANVSKRILPQIIYKGYVLRREKRCSKGLFFVCPTPVLERIKARLATNMLEYPIAAGTVTFQAYDLGPANVGSPRPLLKGQTFTTTVEQVAYAFVSPVNLPEMGVYEIAIKKALAS